MPRSPRHDDGRISGRERDERSVEKTRTWKHTEVKSEKADPPFSRDKSPKREHKRKKEKRKKSKKHKKKSSDSDSDSSDDDQKPNAIAEDLEDSSLCARLEQERERRRFDRKVQREKMKALETPEEKRARRMEKKLTKEQKKKRELGWSEEFVGYSNVDNPFGDAKLTDTFVWAKKLKKEGLGDISAVELERRTRHQIESNKNELEKYKKMREAREAAKEENELMMREREAEQHQEWEKAEDVFHLNQARLRSKIRIKESRAKPIDLLARYIHAEEEEDDMDIQMQEPYQYLNGLDRRDLEDLLEDIKVYLSLEGEKNADYWRDVSTIAEEELNKLKRLDGDADNYSRDRREGIHGAVRRDVAAILKGKSHRELALLETEILRKMKSGAEGVDVSYWESLLGQLKAHMARARLRDRHQDTLRSKLDKLKMQQQRADVKKEQMDNAADDDDIVIEEPEGKATEEKEPKAGSSGKLTDEPTSEQQEITWSELTVEEREGRCCDDYAAGSYSPAYVAADTIPAGVEVTDAVQDGNRLKFARDNLKNVGSTTSQADAAFQREAQKGMGGDEATFAVEAPLEQQTYLWSDKYRPRKPRYFNRVHTGFEWNKYNQTHYDLDNPPPKIVQGYRFNIFFPDLLDTTKAPEFTLIPCDDEDFAVLRFTAGPPYEDIAFKIVNREWEISHRKGYRCAFQNGIFQLWFHFKKYRYRR